jgi:predicted aspartyl protease
MTHSIRRCLVVLLTFFIAPPLGAEDKPSAKPRDTRRAAMVRAGYTPVPLVTDSHPGYFYVNGSVGREKAKFLLDSGCQVTEIDMKLAERLKLKLGETVAPTVVGGKSAARFTKFPGLTLGPYDTSKDWSQLDGLAEDLSGEPNGHTAVLGMDVLDRYGAVVDYPARTAYLRPLLTTAWPRLAGTWTVTNWQEEGAARKIDPKAPPTVAFADRRLKLIDGDTTREFAIQLMPYGSVYVVLLFDPKQEGKPSPVVLAAGQVKVKDGAMTACLDLNKPKAIPPTFAAPKGSGFVLLELKRTALDDQNPSVDPLSDMLIKDGYTAVPLDREPDGYRTAVARVGGHDLRLVVDTGATVSAFDTAGLDKWGAMRLGKLEADSFGRKVECEEVRFRGLTLGGYDTRRAWVEVHGGAYDLSGLNDAMAQYKRRPVQGMLGNVDLLSGSAVIDFGTNTLYLRPFKLTVGPELEGKWVAVRYESDGRKGQYAPGDAAIEFKDGRIQFTTQGGTTERGFHLQDLGDRYRVGLFAQGADELANGFTYSGVGLLKLAGGTLTLVTTQATTTQAPEQRSGRGIGRRSGPPVVMAEMKEPTDFAAPAGSGLLLVEYERAK